jgi:hypothetical protein
MGFLSGEFDVASKLANEFFSTVAQKVGAVVAGTDGVRVGIDPILIMTIASTIFGWVQKCRELKQEREVQPSIASAHADAQKAEKQRTLLAGKISVELRKLQKDEQRRAKAAKRPADIGRYQLDEAAVYRLADHSIASFVALPADKAAGIVAACKPTGA